MQALGQATGPRRIADVDRVGGWEPGLVNATRDVTVVGMMKSIWTRALLTLSVFPIADRRRDYG